MKIDDVNPPDGYWVSCTCNTCSGLIEFDASLFQSGTTIPCPHCSIDTALYIPHKLELEQKSIPKPVIEPAILSSEVETKPIYFLEGNGFSSLEVYVDRVVIIGGGILSGGSVKTIPFNSQ